MIRVISMNLDHIPKRNLIQVHYLYVAVDALILIAVLIFQLISRGHTSIIAHWGLIDTTAIVAGIHFLYGVGVYPWFQKRNTWLATVISQGLFDLVFAALIYNSGYDNLIYRYGWVITVGLSAALGVYIIITEVVIDALLNILGLIGITRSGTVGQGTEWLLTGLAAMSGLIGWLIFRHFYEKVARDNRFEQLNRNLTQTQLQTNLIFQSISDGVVVFDVSGKITAMNEAAASLLGWTVKDAVGLDVHLVMKLTQEDGHPLDANKDLFMEVLHNQQRSAQTVQINGVSDKRFIISLVVSPIVVPPSDVVGAVAVFRDITAEHQEQQQRADFISTASHEMRTPVAAIEGYLSLALNDKVSTIDAKARGFLEKAHESTQHLGQLFQDLLTSAKAEDGRISNHPQVVEMGAYLKQLAEDLRFAAEKKQLDVEFVASSNDLIDARQSAKKTVVQPLYYVHVDPDRMREVITNLFDNAVKYTESGKVSLGITGDNSVVQIFIKDTGAGIPAEDIPHLFQKFYRVDNSATRTIGGTGLGLFICRKIVELYQGRIWVESKLGVGSTFFINLPRLSAEKAAQLQVNEAAKSPVA